jgi:hypothetical protein
VSIHKSINEKLGILLSHTVTQYVDKRLLAQDRVQSMNLGLPRFPEFERDAGRRNK